MISVYLLLDLFLVGYGILVVACVDSLRIL